jgi:hypothetical protein
MALMRREPFALAAPSASGAGVGSAVQPGPRANFHGEPNLLPRNLPAAAERGSLEPGHASLPWAGGPSACRRHRRPSPGSPDYCLCPAGNPILEHEPARHPAFVSPMKFGAIADATP